MRSNVERLFKTYNFIIFFACVSIHFKNNKGETTGIEII